MVAVRHLGFLKIRFFETVSRVQRVNLRHHAKIRGSRSNRCRAM